MKKLLTCACALLLFTGCNMQLIDVTYHYNYAIITLNNGLVVEGNVSSWTDYKESDSIQVVIDGVTYYTHLSNCVLMKK